MSPTVYTLPQPTGAPVVVVTTSLEHDHEADPGAYAVVLDAVAVAGLDAQLRLAHGPYGLRSDGTDLYVTGGGGSTLVPCWGDDDSPLFDFGSVGLPWEELEAAPVIAHAEDVHVSADGDPSDPWVSVLVHGDDDPDDTPARLSLTLTAREAHELAAELMSAAVEAMAMVDEADDLAELAEKESQK